MLPGERQKGLTGPYTSCGEDWVIGVQRCEARITIEGRKESVVCSVLLDVRAVLDGCLE